MKKYLGIVLAAMFVFGFAASAFAIHAEIPAETQAIVAKGTTQITLGGELRFRGEYKHATDLNSTNATTLNKNANENADDSDSAYDGRVRLRLQADVSKNTMGVVHLESGTDTADTYSWGGSAEGYGVYPRGNGKRGNLAILEAWIQTKGNGLGIPAGLKVGHMPLALGNGIFFNHTKFGDDAIVFFMDPTKNLHIGLLTIKIAEGTTTITDDADAYVGLFTYKGKGFNLSGDVTYLVDQRANITSAGLASTSTMTAGDHGTQVTNIGLRGDVMIGALGLKADIEWQTGKSDFETGTDIKHKGKAFVAGATYKVDPATLLLEYGYGSGDNNATDTQNSVFITAVPNTQNLTYVYDYRVVGATGSKNAGIANTTYVKLGAAGDLTKDLKANIYYYWLRATKSDSATAINSKSTGASTHLSKKIGTELDAKIEYKIDRNLVYFVEGGYLWTGTFYDGTQTGGEAVNAKNAYAVRHGITLSF